MEMERSFDPYYYPEFLCTVCGDRYTDAPDRPCSNCRDQDTIDREPWLDDPNDPINWPVPPGHLSDEEQRKWLDDYAAGMIAEEPKAQYSEFALIGCSICGATGQPLFGGVCSFCFVGNDDDESEV